MRNRSPLIRSALFGPRAAGPDHLVGPHSSTLVHRSTEYYPPSIKTAMNFVGVFENPAALAKLAALNPLAEGAVASSSAAAGGSAGRKDGKRTIASSGGKVAAGAERIGGEFTPEADPAWLKERDTFL